MLKRTGCIERQQRLLKRMEQENWDLFVTGNFRTVYYFTGALTPADVPALLAIHGDGKCTLVTSSKQAEWADEILPLETWSMDRAVTMPMRDATSLLANALLRKPGAPISRCAVEMAATPGLVEGAVRHLSGASITDASETLLALRKRKEEDEIEEIRQALGLCSTAYLTARDAIEPGLTEIDVFNALQSAVTRSAGTSVALLGDFACGERAIGGGGPPTERLVRPNDLYILDLFPAPALYFGDTCRTFSVGPPTDLQYRAWEIVNEAVQLAESSVKPGVAARDVYRTVKEFLDGHELTAGSFLHHAGH